MDDLVKPSSVLADAQRRAQERMEKIEREEEERTRERREGRKQGKLSRSLVETIGACTPKQLRRVIEVARQNLRNYRKAPELCQVRVYGKLLASGAHRNKFYTLELRSCGKENCRKCPHGPYVFAYQRDGHFYRPKSQPNFSRLPKPVRDLFDPIRARLRRDDRASSVAD